MAAVAGPTQEATTDLEFVPTDLPPDMLGVLNMAFENRDNHRNAFAAYADRPEQPNQHP
jgi:hypothetical protein